MLWVIILLILIFLGVGGLANQRQAANRAKELERHVTACAAGLRRRNETFAAITDAELMIEVTRTHAAHRRPVGRFVLGGVLAFSLGLVILAAGGSHPGFGVFAAMVLLFLLAAALLIWSYVNFFRNLRKFDIQSAVEDAFVVICGGPNERTG